MDTDNRKINTGDEQDEIVEDMSLDTSEDSLVHPIDSTDSTSDDESDDIISEEDDYSPAKIKKLKADLKQSEKEKLEYLTLLQRTKADYINSKKDDEKRRAEIITFANESLLTDLLPALDAFDMAMSNKEAWEKVDKNWRSGIEYIYTKIVQVLADNNISIDDPKGKPFDVNTQNPVGVIETTDKSEVGKVAEVFQKGYLIKGKSIRPASVKVFEIKEE